MTVSELIHLLKGYPPEMRVLVNGYEEGWDDLSPEQLVVTEIQLNTGVNSWQGKHDEPECLPKTARDSSKIEGALTLRRNSN